MASPERQAEIMACWDYADPVGSEARFRALLPRTAAASDQSVHLCLLTQIARAQCLQRRHADAHATLDQVERGLSAPGAGGDALPRVRYLLERGRVRNDQRQPAAARQCFHDAFAAAAAAGCHGLAVDALHMLGVMDPPDEAVRWNHEALAYIAAHPDDAEARTWTGSVRSNLGWTLVRLERLAEALDVFSDLERWHRGAGRAVAADIARWSAARVLRLLGRVAEALIHQRELLALQETGFRQEEMGECLLALGRRRESRAHFARAHALLQDDVMLLARGESQRIDRLARLAAEDGAEDPGRAM